ncbi:class I SAM-dependent methyltransferase [Methanohalophilus sp. RSK]|uniref:class I SAM-dependent methyltransferase n=1 Tax=Methanohalophilus sp. RSK TaxID=2485783 RepID=UPI000F439E36|nr:class I SAM-dependent methyltransferase [Methanohalophilus sp. RSK]RNI15801.1 class I SAM-dependent methyltransferase [Methanohalophilus sp. RSK]
MKKLSFKELTNVNKEDSFVTKLRLKRIALFKDIIPKQKPISILDIGGTATFWKMMGFADDPDYSIKVLNLSANESNYNNIEAVSGDARDLSEYSDNSFDIVFSNSVIEHVGTYDDQRKMALEILRVGKQYFVQTPNYYFPFEPHFLIPCFQYLPFGLRVRLIQRFNLGHMKRTPDKDKAEEVIKSVRLLNRKEIQELFPEGHIHNEKLFGLNYSFIAYGDCI